MENKTFEEFLSFCNTQYKTTKVDIDSFIANHNHIRYCEAIIFKNGEIAYVRPSHTETLIRECMSLLNVTREELDNGINPFDDYLTKLVDISGCVAVWYDFCIPPKTITEGQINSLDKLMQSKGIINDIDFKIIRR